MTDFSPGIGKKPEPGEIKLQPQPDHNAMIDPGRRTQFRIGG
jgi:hypothetical protein